MKLCNHLLSSLKALGAAFAAVALAAFALVTSIATPAGAVPSFAQQTGQPCSACHVGAFGPQLKPYGRDFKLYGYQSSDGKSHEPPIAVMAMLSETHTGASQTPPPAPHFGPNDNFAVDQLSMFYAGKFAKDWGAFAQVTYDGVARHFQIDNIDIRRAKETTLLGKDSVVGIDFNNNPTVQDVWNSTPAWSFPYNSSALSTGGPPHAVIDGGLAHQVVGAGVYGMWDDTLYAEATLYQPLERQFAGRLSAGTNIQSDRYVGPIPYGRLSLVHDIGAKESFQAGLYALRAESYPGGSVQFGTNTYSDTGVDANYQYIGSETHVISAHATYLFEHQDLAASEKLNPGSRGSTDLSTSRADVTYSYKNTWTPSVQAFRTDQTTDPFTMTNRGRTTGYVAELAYIPWGKPGSPLYWLNSRLAVQYVGYREFNGDRAKASDNNTLYVSLWIAIAPFGALVHR